ncbi:MAG: hypothetical protein U5R49_05250 [Deltaproteobacteria bacterium]|nr:hypothetical protein [Deltaproteobacteria bacterium]
MLGFFAAKGFKDYVKARQAPDGRPTGGMTVPPLHATACRRLSPGGEKKQSG